MIDNLRAAAGRALAPLRRVTAARPGRATRDARLQAAQRCDLPSCTIALVGITQATGVLAFDFRSR